MIGRDSTTTILTASSRNSGLNFLRFCATCSLRRSGLRSYGDRCPRTSGRLNFSIVAQYQAEFRGIAGYYQLAFNLHQLDRLKHVMQRSLVKTLARKYRVRVPRIYQRYRTVLKTDQGPRRGLQVTVERSEGRTPLVAQWGGGSH
ncbi:group II intron reverse transcriptase/maturase [Streptomyces sp. NPDC055140]